MKSLVENVQLQLVSGYMIAQIQMERRKRRVQMEIINIQFAWTRWFGEVLRKFTDLDSVTELATIARSEIALSDNRVRLYRKNRIDEPLLNNINYVSFGDITQLSQSIVSGEELVLSIHREDCFNHSLEVPTTSMSRIDQILKLEISRLTPFRPEQVMSGWSIESASPDRDRILVNHCIFKRAILESALQQLREVKARPIAILVRKGSDSVPDFALSVDGEKYSQREKARWLRLSAVGFIGLLCAAGLFTFLLFGHQTDNLEILNSEAEKYQTDALNVRKMLDLRAALAGEIDKVAARRSAAFSKLAILEELSHILPDSAYIDGISMLPDQIVAEGAAENPEALVSALETSTLFKDVTFNAPTFQNPGDSKSRFSLKFKMEERE